MTYTLIPGEPHDASDDETILMIRAMLTEQAAPSPAKAGDQRAAGDGTGTMPGEGTATKATVAAARRRAAFAELHDPDPTPMARRAPLLSWPKFLSADRLSFRLPPLPGKLRAFRPTTRHLAIVSMLFLCVIRPHWVMLGLALAIGGVVAAFLFLGSDRIWGTVLKRLSRIATRDPVRAAYLRARLNAFAYRWNSILDRFPGGMMDRLYLPDFQSFAQAEERHATAMSERLARLGQDG